MKSIIKPFAHGKKRSLLLVISAIVLLTLATGTTVALIITNTDTPSNIFVPPVTRISLDGYDDISNVGNVPVYVRAFAVANWLSTEDEHTVLSETPKEDEDFIIETVSEGWFLASDGFFYYEMPLGAGEHVALFTEAVQISEREGYELRLQILSSSIQASPSDAVHQAWPAVQVNENGKLEPATTP